MHGEPLALFFFVLHCCLVGFTVWIASCKLDSTFPSLLGFQFQHHNVYSLCFLSIELQMLNVEACAPINFYKHVDVIEQHDQLNEDVFLFFLLAHGFPLFIISDQQHLVFCFAAHINVLVPPICNTFQQWDLPHMDSPGCGW